MQNYNVMWGSHASPSSASRKLCNTTHCLTALWLVFIIMRWDSIPNRLLQTQYLEVLQRSHRAATSTVLASLLVIASLI